jgi:hypothetical protein
VQRSSVLKTGGCCAPDFSKENYTGERHSRKLRIGKCGTRLFSKAFGTAPRNVLANRDKELAGFYSFGYIKKLFALHGSERLIKK